MSEPKFPIYCKQETGGYVFMIISKTRVLSVCDSPWEIGVSMTDYGDKDHHNYTAWKKGELTEISEKDFHFHRIEINNRMAVGQKVQTTKSES